MGAGENDWTWWVGAVVQRKELSRFFGYLVIAYFFSFSKPAPNIFLKKLI